MGSSSCDADDVAAVARSTVSFYRELIQLSCIEANVLRVYFARLATPLQVFRFAGNANARKTRREDPLY